MSREKAEGQMGSVSGFKTSGDGGNGFGEKCTSGESKYQWCSLMAWG